MNNKTQRIRAFLFPVLASLLAGGCSRYAYTNVRLSQPLPETPKAAIRMSPDRERGNDRALVILALSGGGSRAAYWSGTAMLRLGDVFGDPKADLLKEVDAISSVSGGSLPAAYYAISRDPDDPPGRAASDRAWDEKTVKDLMTRSYRTRWFWNLFWPGNITRYWFTAFDRTDIMAQVFADNLYDKKPTGVDLRFRDLNPERPYLILNATIGSSADPAVAPRLPANREGEQTFGQGFTFTAEQFQAIQSDLSDYEIARAVMASATFPGVFNYMTLKDYRGSEAAGKEQYQHLFDGGNNDNLGLDSADRIIETNQDRYDAIVVILVDAYTEPRGISSSSPDGRRGFGYVLDTNFLDSFDSLLNKARQTSLWKFSEKMRHYRAEGKSTIFYHVKFDNLRSPAHRRLLARLNRIVTDFDIDDEGVRAVDEVAALLFTPANPCLRRIRRLIIDREPDRGDPWCTYDLN